MKTFESRLRAEGEREGYNSPLFFCIFIQQALNMEDQNQDIIALKKEGR